MSLLTPDFGLFFWMTLAFGVLVILLGKYAWKPILKGLSKREARIEEALNKATQAQDEVKQLEKRHQEMLAQAQQERDQVVREARALREKILEEARVEGEKQAEYYRTKAEEAITRMREDERLRIRKEVVYLTLQVTETILREKMQDSSTQQAHVERLLDEMEAQKV